MKWPIIYKVTTDSREQPIYLELTVVTVVWTSRIYIAKINVWQLTNFSLDIEKEGERIFLVAFHVSPLELKRSLDSPSVRRLGNVYNNYKYVMI